MNDEPAGRPPLGLFIVDDHPAVREGLRLLVSSEGMEVVGEAGGRADAVARLAACAPDLVVVDLSLDGEDGLGLVSELHQRGVPVLVYSMHSDGQHVQGAFEAGALGYVTKAEFRGILVDAILTVAAGRRFVSPRAAQAIAEAMASEHAHPLAALSPQERQVYRLVGQGEGTHGIATAMGISPHTVESYCERIQQKLRLEGMHALRLHAVEHFHDPA